MIVNFLLRLSLLFLPCRRGQRRKRRESLGTRLSDCYERQTKTRKQEVKQKESLIEFVRGYTASFYYFKSYSFTLLFFYFVLFTPSVNLRQKGGCIRLEALMLCHLGMMANFIVPGIYVENNAFDA